MRKLFVTLRNLYGHPTFIGVLSEDKDKYFFEYSNDKIGLDKFLVLSEFPDVSKKYSGKVVEDFIYEIIPRETDDFADFAVKCANLDHYDPWELLKYSGTFEMGDMVTLYEEIPRGTVVYGK